MSYTYANATDDGQGSQTFTTGNSVLNPSNLGFEHGRSSFDIRHRFVSSVVWQPQYFKDGNTIVKAITSDWTIAPIFGFSSGKPLTGTLGSDNLPSCTIVLAPGVTTCPSASRTGAISTGIEGAGGSNRLRFIPVNDFQYPDIYNVDLRVSRRVKVMEGKNLEFLAEAFNLFNHMNVTDVQTKLYSIGGATPQAATLTYNPAFNTATGASSTIYRERQIQFAVRFQF
jgi:hypothetical protein